ncbi:MAG: 4-hydroxythreonine-4-phosphate dehydrogenase PdxA [Hyphomicrobium aestuarii]|nr:4-hydroxythreonine-4-phosphate dehydrogenase PdxA [Hyphomicrobium aestuarii]
MIDAHPNPAHTSPLAVTMGDPSGIGLEITLDAWLARTDAGLPTFAFYADPGVLAARAAAVGRAVPVCVIGSISEAVGVFHHSLPVIPVLVSNRVEPGRPDPANGQSVISSIDRAVADVLAGRASGVVTNPIAKSVLYASGFAYPGHTEYLAYLAKTAPDRSAAAPSAIPDPLVIVRPVMMLVGADLRTVPVTIHIPLARVPSALTPGLIEETIRITANDLTRWFGIAQPRIAVAGLNPHAGEDGTIGTEDRDLIAPVIERLRAEGFVVSGPHPADTLFHASARTRYDAAVCMYHDQALIPVKTLAFDTGVNVTLGLPFVRTSPDHGTAFDIAGRGVASPASLIAALQLAGQMATLRQPPIGHRPPVGHVGAASNAVP